MARKKHEEAEENIFWVTMSDLFLGMFMVFATLFFAFVTNSGQGSQQAAQEATQEMVQEVAEEMQKQNISVRLINENKPAEPGEAHEKVNVEMDPETGLVRISDLELFDLNSATLTPKGRAFLDKFIPVYFDCIYKKDLAKYISTVTIQGHTDSTNFKGNYTVEQQYMKNMNLSMNRAYNVANFVFYKCSNKPYQHDLTHTIKVEGVSSARPIIVDGKEDKSKSRRVELRIILKRPTDNVIQQFLTNGANYEDIR
ncbi:MAG: flagellar motor protein MotB [Candidatus Gastranaerophilaceae bacterium]